jgi:putative membrane protein
VQRWRGVILVGLVMAATLWLAATNQLVLYIHPRYIMFTIVMAVLALVLVLVSVTARFRHEDDEAPPRGLPRILSILAMGIATVLALAMVALPPATLTSATASQRDINSTSVGPETQSVSDAENAPADAFSNFTVVDWASLLRQTVDAGFYEGKAVDVVGFVTPDADDPQNVFYVSRFVVTCCAVDAQPAGVPVYLPDWTSVHAADDWVRVTGEFAVNGSDRSEQPLAIVPDAVTAVEQPSEPYLY